MERITASEFRRRQGLEPAVATDNKPQIRLPKERRPNKTEAEWMDRLRRTNCDHPGFTVLYEPFTLRLPSGTKYTPDVVTVQGRVTGFEIAPVPLGYVCTIYEVKGAHIHNSASIRAFKEARAAFPFWTFVFCQKTKEGWATA
jgi:hypothetical protein